MDSALSGTSRSHVVKVWQNHEPSRAHHDRWIDLGAALTALVAIWWIAIDHMRIEWSINEQYNYGWAVPWLALYLFAGRWTNRPSPQSPAFRHIPLAFLAIFALAWLPAHLLQLSSPDWRLLGWAFTGLAVVFTLAALYLIGGGAWLRHFWFPVAFTLIAVPWPVPFEQSVVQSLMRIVAGTSVEALHWCGFPAVQQGNVIKVGTKGAIGIEEACSGVRSLQTMVMTALLLGELWHRPFWKRLVLLAVGLGLAFAINIARAFTLAWLTASQGMEYSRHLHDHLGLVFLALTLTSFGAFAYFWREVHVRGADSAVAASIGKSSLPAWQWSAALLGWLFAVWIGTEFWYRSGEELTGPKCEIVIQWPEKEVGFRELSIPTRTGIILRHDESRSATWKNDDGESWSMVYLRWKAGSAAVQLARAHTPDICLPAAGGRLEADRGILVIPAGEATLPAHAYIFNVAGRPMHVFYIRVGDDAGSDRIPSDIEELTIQNRLGAALAKRRNRGQQVVEVAISSSRSPEEVTASLKEFSRAAFRVSGATGS